MVLEKCVRIEMDNKRYITNDEIAVTDGSKSNGGVRRCRDTELTSSGSGKRRKLDLLLQENAVQSEIQCRSAVDVNLRENVVSSAKSSTCDHVSSSSCFKNCLRLDPKVETRFENETSMYGNGGFSRETTPSSEICLDSDEMESSSTMKMKPAPPPAVTTDREPATAAEIEEFFSVAEKKEQKRFLDKYNFDLVNDVPIEGRYQWVQLKP